VIRALAAVFAIAAISCAGALPAAAQPADTVLLNGKVVTLDAQSSLAQALAIRDDKIIATGASAEIVKLANAKTRVIDLDGRTVIPGLIDSHIHAIRAGLKFSTEVSWIGATSIAEAMERIRVAAIYARPGTWIVVGGGWTPTQFAERRRPTQAELIAAAPEHPVYVQLFYRAAALTPPGLKALGPLRPPPIAGAGREHGRDAPVSARAEPLRNNRRVRSRRAQPCAGGIRRAVPAVARRQADRAHRLQHLRAAARP
jgi:predicted amidohydrolase YtcJ